MDNLANHSTSFMNLNYDFTSQSYLNSSSPKLWPSILYRKNSQLQYCVLYPEDGGVCISYTNGHSWSWMPWKATRRFCNVTLMWSCKQIEKVALQYLNFWAFWVHFLVRSDSLAMSYIKMLNVKLIWMQIQINTGQAFKVSLMSRQDYKI